jgi:hypothetical protein
MGILSHDVAGLEARVRRHPGARTRILYFGPRHPTDEARIIVIGKIRCEANLPVSCLSVLAHARLAQQRLRRYPAKPSI